MNNPVLKGIYNESSLIICSLLVVNHSVLKGIYNLDYIFVQQFNVVNHPVLKGVYNEMSHKDAIEIVVNNPVLKGIYNSYHLLKYNLFFKITSIYLLSEKITTMKKEIKKTEEPLKKSIHRALAELKMIDKKIIKATESIAPLAIYQQGKKISGHIELDKFATNAKSCYDSIMSLIELKNRIKNAIVAANAVTKVMVGGVEMTVADAINFKSLIEYKKSLLARLQFAGKSVKADLERQNAAVAVNLQKNLEAVLGKDNVKSDSDDVKNITVPFLANNEYKLHDPLDIDVKISTLEKEISDFESEVDFTLSESNATTFIEY